MIEANTIAPLMLIRAVLPAMRQRHFGRIVNITSAMVTTPRPHMTLSSGARGGLTAAMKGLSLEVARDNVTINNLLPEANAFCLPEDGRVPSTVGIRSCRRDE